MALLMRALQAFNENDLPTVNQIVAEDMVYRVSGREPIAGDRVWVFGGVAILAVVRVG